MQNSGEGIGSEQSKALIEAAEARHADAPAGALEEKAPALRGVPLRLLKQKHPEYDWWYWRKLRALYKGGKALLSDEKVLAEIFPRHRDEHPEIYEERCRRAFYTPYAGEIVGHLVSALFTQPVSMKIGDEKSAHLADEWWEEFCDDCSPEGGRETKFDTLCRDAMLTAQQCRRAWVLVDLPAMYGPDGSPVVYADRAAQEKAGGLNAYVIQVEPESVVDWDCDDSGRLDWALLHVVESRRRGIMGDREMETHRWTYYDREGWQVYELTHPKKRPPKKDTIIVPLIAEGTHNFGEVPLVRLGLPDGLWTMEKLEGLAREHFNKRSGLAWGELQSLLPELYEFNGPEENYGAPVSVHQEDTDRATSQPRGQGFVQTRGHQDRAEFIGPDVAPFMEARKSCDSLRDEMHRVTHQMALSVDNSSAALRRSADSKAQDQAATAVVLGELGRIVRQFAEQIYRLVAIARGERELAELWEASGMEKYDAVAIDSEIEQALVLDQLAIESPTFRRTHRLGLIKLKLGDEASPEDLETIEEELKRNIPSEWEPGGADGSISPFDLQSAMDSAVVVDDEDDDDENDDDESPRQRHRRKAAAAAYSSTGMK